MLDASAPIRAPPPRPVASSLLCLLGSWCSPGSRVCVVALSWRSLRSRGLSQQRCDTVVIWQLLQDYHSSCAFPFPSFCGSNFLDTQHTDWFYKAGWRFSFCYSASTIVTSGFSFLTPPIGFSQPVLLCESRQNETLAGEREKKENEPFVQKHFPVIEIRLMKCYVWPATSVPTHRWVLREAHVKTENSLSHMLYFPRPQPLPPLSLVRHAVQTYGNHHNTPTKHTNVEQNQAFMLNHSDVCVYFGVYEYRTWHIDNWSVIWV